ncbi:2,3-bisphosphoglycerate-independent phosphoglycerate mutase [Alteromonas lipolytica]|uniref:2,3-bisphosphoglycerate-independent phosphoglycerate mutase n=1 Tax=Alteromonas lipolytica TaxID=1856405 RepID=A0A1E8FBH4_9ALTE|nr:2,3-bisphosphoglycerate-independent phosphoglycerate mutase [Alteromonas lipolytica]OFI33260.1 phosphoglycerate mutase (2,3-diphosphoglycerate-independent) [Alteromonas lipolytica]GGF61233.1 2,3-bisphosphoglycerate-independent phosphoglycerate mutase [Alteromonas lipolytica]
MTQSKKTLALIVLDGWGYREDADQNAILAANTPNLDALTAHYPHTLISGSGLDVGLPEGQMGNSEVGHVNLGAGRVVYQDFTKVTKSIADGEFEHNPALVKAIDDAVSNDKAVHIMGLLSPGGVHSHEDHIFAAIRMAAHRGAKKVYLHAFLDGRDTPPQSAQASLEKADAVFAEIGCGKTATIIGRYFAMDRDKRWDRVQKAYDLITQGKGEATAESAVAGLKASYDAGKNDEFVPPTVIGDSVSVADGDSIIFMNFRADRARQLTQVFVDKNFDGFELAVKPELAAFVMLTQYSADFDAPVAFPAEKLVNVLGEWLEKQHKTQLRISETEKYAHVTFFFSGGVEKEFEGEDRILIPSPDVATYDLQPEMNSEKLTDELVGAIESGKYDVIICNYPNGDMVGHTGDFNAAVKACEAVDTSIGRVVEALKKTGGECLITADHGNAEQMVDNNTGQAHTAHTSEPVPFIYFGRSAEARTGGTLSDVAPTILHLLGMEQPKEMTGTPIMTLKS